MWFGFRVEGQKRIHRRHEEGKESEVCRLCKEQKVEKENKNLHKGF